VETGEHIDALRAASARLAAAAAAAGPDTAVPSCPEWVVRDLVRHQGGVHRWATGIVGTPRTEPWAADLDEIVGAWPADADLITWFSDGADKLARTLADADPALVCWAFLAAPSPLAMWSRRQAHETSVHAVDAELAAGWPPAEVPAPFAADGVSELLTCFITRSRRELRADPARRLRVRCADADGDWLVTIGPDRVITTSPGPAGREADCEITGSAGDLYLALWNRRPPSVLTVRGDPDVLGLFLNGVRVRW
jgi:uncharacterized protein (TIGR03083 family)